MSKNPFKVIDSQNFDGFKIYLKPFLKDSSINLSTHPLNALKLIKLKKKDVFQIHTNIMGYVCYLGNLPFLKELLKLNLKYIHLKDPLISMSISRNDSSKTYFASPLFICCYLGHVDLVKEFLKHKEIDINHIYFMNYSHDMNREDFIAKRMKECESTKNNNFSNVQFIETMDTIDLKNAPRSTKQMTSLVGAVMGNQLDVVKILLQKTEINVNLTDPLLEAVYENNFDIIQALLNHKEININQGYIYTPAYVAAKNGYLNVIKLFLSRKEFNVNGFGQIRFLTPLYGACEGKQVEICKMLLKHKNIVVNEVVSPLFVACNVGSFEIVKMLLSRKDIKVNDGIMNPVSGAIDGSHIEILKCLLERKDVDINFGNINPLTIISYKNDVKLLKLLLKRKDLNINNGMFDWIVGLGYENIVKEILTRKDLNVNKVNDGITALGTAALIGHMGIFNMLLNHKDIQINAGYETPLYNAVKGNCIEIANILLKRKDILINKGEYSPLFIACRFLNVKFANLLLKRSDIDVNAGEIPAFIAAIRSGCNEITSILINRNDFDIRNYVKYPLVLYAVESGDLETLRLLMSFKEVDVNKVQNQNYPLSGLYKACKNNNFEMVVELLRHPKIDYNAGIDSPLAISCNLGRINIVKELVKLNGIDYTKGIPLFSSCKSRKFEVVKELLKRMPYSLQLENDFVYCVKEKLCDYVILFLQRNLNFDYVKIDEIIKENKDKDMDVIIKEFKGNKSKFRAKYKNDEKYGLGVVVREFLRVAFVIGFMNYKKLSKLKTSINDAVEIEKLLKNNLNFDIVHLLTDADLVSLQKKFNSFLLDVKNLSKSDKNKHKTLQMCIYYSGHGISFGQESYILPIDFEESLFLKDYQNKDELSCCLSISYMQNEINRNISVESCVIFVLDACRFYFKSDKMIEIKKSHNERENRAENSKEKGKMEYVISFSTSPDSPAFDQAVNSTVQNSPFTSACLGVLKQKGKFEDFLIEVRNKVIELTKGNQIPWYSYNISYELMWNEEIEYLPKMERKDENVSEKYFSSINAILKKMKNDDEYKERGKGEIEKVLNVIDLHLSKMEKINNDVNNKNVEKVEMKRKEIDFMLDEKRKKDMMEMRKKGNVWDGEKKKMKDLTLEIFIKRLQKSKL